MTYNLVLSITTTYQTFKNKGDTEMRETMNKLTHGATRLLVLALGLGLVSTAWAVKPAVVWNGDIYADTLTRNGFTLVTNDNVVVDGKITLVSTAKGVTLAPTSGGFGQTQGRFTAVVGYSNIVANAKSGALWTLYTNRDGDTTGVSLNNYSFIGVNLGNANYTLTTSGTFPSDGGLYYVGAYFSTDRVANYSTLGGRGSYAWVKSGDTAISAGKDGLVYSQESTYYGMTFGGFKDESGHQLTDAVISYIAYFTNQQEVASTTVSTWSLSNMKTVGTDIGAATAETGVNLPASATLTASVSPAAVFVQQTSTLTMTGSASLTINSGTGPLYVADGTTLTIDATGITSLTDQNPSVTLVSANIYGTDLITVKAPVVSGGRVSASVTESGITLSYSVDSVTFTSPFTGAALAAPTTATAYGESATEISFGNNEKFNQTIGDRTAIVVDITGGTYEKLNGFLRTAENTAADARSKDVYLALTGGTANRVSGVQDCTTWSYAGTTTTTGDSIVQIQEGATVDFVYGAGGAGGYSGYQVVVNGSSGVSIKGGTVRGSVVGGWTSSHNLNPTVNYDTAVLVETVLGTATAAAGTDIPAGYIIGGSAHNRNSTSASTVGRNSFVTLSLADKSGAFDRTIIGGSAQVGGATSGNQAVTGNSSVTIIAANDVRFANSIIGGGAKLVNGGQGSVTVGGNSSVTIAGGTYTGRIVAGGYAPNGGTANVSGTAMLTINSGVFTGATLDGGNATGAKTLVVGDNLDISDATVTGFTAVTLGNGATAQMETGDEGTATLGSGAVLKLIIEDADIADGYTPSVSGSGTVEYYEYVESVLTKITDAARLDGNNLRSSAPVWSPATADASGNFADTARWSTGLLPENDTAVVKIVVNGSNTLTVNETRAFGHLYVEGSGTLLLEGDGTHHLTVGNLNIASGVTVTINDADDPLYVTDGTIDGSGTLTLANDANLTLDGVTKTTSVSVTIPSGTTLTIGGDGTTTLPLGDQVIAGNLVIEEGATLIATTKDAPDYGSACNVYIYGTLTLNARWSMNANNKIYCYTGATINGTGDNVAALDLLNQNTTIYVNPDPDTQATGTVTCSARIRLRGNATVDVAEGMTFLMTGNTVKQTDNCGYTKTGSGLFHIKGSYAPLGTTTVSDGKILFEDVNFNTETDPGALAGTGTVEFKGSTDHRYFYGDATGFSGKFIVTKADNSKDVLFNGTAPQFSSANPPEFEVSGGVVLTGKYDNKILPVKDFSGAGNISAAFGNVSSHVNRTIDTLQTKDTAFAGTFTYANNNSYHRNAALTVRGADNAESVCALTLSGVSTTYGPLTITNNSKVVFTSAGSWRNGQVTVGKDGWLESTNATVLTSLTLTDGANIVFPTDSSKLTGITSLTFASGTNYISFADGVTPTEGTLIDWSGALLESAPAGDFQLVGSVAGDWILTKSATGLSIAAAAAKVTPTTGDPVAYASVEDAIDAFMGAMAIDEGVVLTILDGTPVSITQAQLATAGVYYDSEAGTLTKAVAKTSAKPYNSLASAVADVESGATITLLRASSEAITLDKAITLTETAAYSGTLSGAGTLTLTALRNAAMTLGAWTGVLVLPANQSFEGTFFDDYGIAGSTVRLQGANTGWLHYGTVNATTDRGPIATTIEIPEGASLIITSFSPSWANTFNVLKGAGTFAVNLANEPAHSYSEVSAYFLLKDVSNFAGSLSVTGAGIAIGAAKPAYTTAGGKIMLTTSATIAAGKTWTATGGIVLADAAATLTNTDGALDPAPTTTVANSYVKLAGSTYSVDTYKTVTFAGSNFSVAVTTNGQAVAVANNACTVEAGEISFTITPSSGYQVTAVTPSSGSVSGEGPYTYTVSGDVTITVTTAQESSVEIGAATFEYGADYTNATVRVAVTETNASGVMYTLTVGGKPYVATASGGVVTFDDVEVPRGAAYGTVGYEIISTANTTTGDTSGSAPVATTTAWINENSATHGQAIAGGAWTNAEAVAYSGEGKADISDNRFVATEASTASRVVLEFQVCFSSASEETVSGDAQAAIKLGEDDNVTTFRILTAENTWTSVSNAELPIEASKTYNVVLTIDYGSKTYKVDVDGISMTNSAGVASFALAMSTASVQNIDFAGSGTLTSLKGDQLEGYMVKDALNNFYATIEAAIQAYNSANGPYTVLHEGTTPDGWKIDEATKALIKLAKGFFFMAY